jgi:hypothetical protein
MNILDYYLRMPQQYLKHAGGDGAEARRAALYVNDVEYGYLLAREPDGEFYSALSLFKRADGGDLIAVENRECARGCNEELYLLTYEDGRWKDVTPGMLPAIDEGELRGTLAKQFKTRDGFQPRIMHRLAGGAAPIEVSEYWSGVGLGRLEWNGGEFVFKRLAAAGAPPARTVLASVVNPAGDRLEIIGIEPELPARLPLKGRLNVRVAYELRSARACHIWARPVVLEQRLPDEFTHGSMLYLPGSGELTTWFGFDNQAHLDQLKVTMVDDQGKNLLTVNYSVDANWEGALECPTFRVECFPNDATPDAPLACMVYPSGVRPDGVRPDQKFTYAWTTSKGTITSGQGTRRIILNTDGLNKGDLTARVEVGGLPGKCQTEFLYTVPILRMPR